MHSSQQIFTVAPNDEFAVLLFLFSATLLLRDTFQVSSIGALDATPWLSSTGFTKAVA